MLNVGDRGDIIRGVCVYLCLVILYFVCIYVYMYICIYVNVLMSTCLNMCIKQDMPYFVNNRKKGVTLCKDFPISLLAFNTEGYTSGSFKEAVDEIFTKERLKFLEQDNKKIGNSARLLVKRGGKWEL